MKTDKEILALDLDDSLSNIAKVHWYKRGYKLGSTWGEEYPEPVNGSIHAIGMLHGWQDHYPEARLKLILKSS